ncbi:MAG: TIGR03086 family protein, partial [Actinomycetota bacterium]
AAEALAAVDEPGAISRMVDLSRGPTPAADYVLERIGDAGMHTWDLARALGIDETLHPEVVATGRRLLAMVGDEWRSFGALGPIVATPPGADEQTLFIAESGRTP